MSAADMDHSQDACESFVYGQFQASIRNLEQKKKLVDNLRTWLRAAEANKYPKLAAFLSDYLSSEEKDYNESLKELEPKRMLISEAKMLDEKLKEKRSGK